MTGNAAANRLFTAGGDDTIDVSGDPGNVDEVVCGAGVDTVTSDASDFLNFAGVDRRPSRPDRHRRRS